MIYASVINIISSSLRWNYPVQVQRVFSALTIMILAPREIDRSFIQEKR